jgi:hypothetical protein
MLRIAGQYGSIGPSAAGPLRPQLRASRCAAANCRWGSGPDSCTAANPPSQFLEARAPTCAKGEPCGPPVDSYRHLHCMTMRDGAYCGLSNRLEVRRMSKARNLVLTKSQAACLMALRDGKNFKATIAIQAGLDLVKTAAALGVLARLGLANRARRKGGIPARAGGPAASRPSQTDCGATVGFPAPAPSVCSNC